MKTLLLKLLRDIKTSIGGFISIIFVIGIGSAFFSGLLNSVNSVDNLINNYYEQQNFMDYIAYFKGVSEEEILKYRDNENIKQLELRHSFDVVFNINNKDTDLRIHTLTENINKPYLYEGKFPELNEIILDKTYMELNNLKIGDTINFKYNSFDFELRISGIMDSPEYVYKVKDAFSGNVDFDGFGIGYIKEETLKNKFDEINSPFVYTDVIIKSKNSLDGLNLFEDINSFVRMIDREDHISFKSFEGALSQIEKVVVIFPIIFFLVAGIITFISMSKTVENQRTQIGIMGALGFSNFRIYFNYVMYSFIGGFIGAILGGIIGIYTIPESISGTFSAQYVFPITPLKLYPEFIIYGIIISILFSITATIISCYKTLREVPANTLKPKPPKKSSHIFIDKFFIWNKMSFTYKIILRNIFYNKMRLILSSIGVIGSIAFLITGFSLKASVEELLDYETRIRKYDFEIRTFNYVNEEEIKNYSENINIVNLSTTILGKFYENNNDKIDIPVVVVKSDNNLISIENTNDEIIKFNDNSVVIPHKFVEDYELKIGDKITLEFDIGDEIKNIDVFITDIGNMYSTQMIYVSENILKNNGMDISFNSAFVKVKEGVSVDDLITELKENENIDGITLVGDIREFAKNIISMINSVIMIIIIGSAILSISVIYNITSINIFERVREISTLLVLGYYDNEINKLIFIENIVLTIFGGILGIPCGIVLFDYMQSLISERGANLPQFISAESIVISFIMILIFSMVTNLFLKRKVLKINMIEALKGVE